MWRVLLLAATLTSACTNDYGAFRYPRARDAGDRDAGDRDAGDAATVDAGADAR